MVVWSLPAGFSGTLPILLIHGYFWFKLLDRIVEKLAPPGEVLISSLFLFILFQALFLSRYLNLSSGTAILSESRAIFPTLFHLLLFAVIILLFSILLVQNSSKKRSVLFLYLFIGYLGTHILQSADEFYIILFQIFLFLILLQKTGWLEELSRAECWSYFFILLILYAVYTNLNPYGAPRPPYSGNHLWLYAPYFVYLLFKLYLLASIVKIPFVMVYHHARLSRKLRIAGLFQSNFPLFIQLILLLLMFYFFIAGWQAENVRKSIVQQIDRIQSEQDGVYRFRTDSSFGRIRLPGHRTLFVPDDLPGHGIIAIEKESPDSIKNAEKDFFLFIYEESDTLQQLTFLPFDSGFVANLARRLHLLAASDLIIYPLQFSKWDSLLYKNYFWQNQKKYSDFRIFPFGLMPDKTHALFSFSLYPERSTSPKLRKELKSEGIDSYGITIGRVFIPVVNGDFRRTGYWAIDVVLTPESFFFTSNLWRQLLFWLLIYFLFNLIVLRRVIKFGNQINRMIVQKFNQLTNGIRQISEGNLDYKISLEGEDEFVELGERFNQMGTQLKKSIAELREKDRLEYELKIARKVQLSLLPRTLPQVPGYRITATIRTANEVGGDFYDVLPLSDNRFLFTIGDVSGKSTSAAFYMAQCLSLIRFSGEFSHRLKEIMIRLNRYFASPHTEREIFITAILGRLDADKNKLHFIRAGHTYPYLIPGSSDAEITELQTSGIGIGLDYEGKIFRQNMQEKILTLKPGDTILFYTDGVIEATRQSQSTRGEEQLEFFDEQQFKELLSGQRGKTAEEMLEKIIERLTEFYRGNPPIDDYTLLIIQREEK